MGIGKYLSLEEARRKKQLDRFIKSHPSKGDTAKFNKLLNRMTKAPSADDQTSRQE